MRRFDVILLFFVFVLSSTVLFQNCAEMEAGTGNGLLETNSSLIPADLNKVPPEYISNRQIDLDNKILSGSISYSFGAGAGEIFTYETDYRAIFESTLAVVKSKNDKTIVEVTADGCKGERVLTGGEIDSFIAMFESSYANSDEKGGGGTAPAPGCSFPRLLMNSVGPGGDVEIYFTGSDCTPDNNLYVSNNDGGNPVAIVDGVKTFFNALIDNICHK